MRRFADLAVAAAMLAIAGLLGGAWLIAHDRPTTRIVVSAGCIFLGASGLFLVFGTTMTPVTRRGRYLWRDPVSAARFQDTLARTREQAMWKRAFEWHHDPQSATGNKSSSLETQGRHRAAWAVTGPSNADQG